MKTAEFFFGSVWVISPEQEEETAELLRNALEADDGTDINDLLDTLNEKYDANVEYSTDGTKTVWVGQGINVMNESENDFDEMGMLRTMDLDTGALKQEIREDVKNKLENVPYDLRDKFSSPGFKIAWGDA